ncbi:MAG: DegQ family serine endoprotease [Gammaproteobacteria bacterium]|nr:DegQ family serine endoprotease [Gammaproteobacteria bacterium]
MQAGRSKKVSFVTGTVAAIAIGATAILPSAWLSPASAAIPQGSRTAAAVPVSSPALPDFSSLVERYGPAVVNITVQQEHGAASHRPGFRGLPHPMPRGPARSEGSGFIVSADGLILTNAHVVDGADTVVVKLTDRREFTASVLGSDEQTDVAVLRIDARNLPTVKLGDPASLRVGEWVLAIGSPFGFENTVTAGIVSAKGRSLPDDTYVPFIQTDVAVNPGNSGGPLFNLAGEVVGINSQIFSRTGGYQGVSFAIPIDVAMDVQKQLVAGGRMVRGWLGVGIQPLSRELAQGFGMDQPRGALVAQITPDSPAAQAGLRPGDVILEFDGEPVGDAGDLPPLVGRARPGSSVGLGLLRDGRELTLTARVGELPVPDGRRAHSNDQDTEDTGGGLGVAVADLTDEQRDNFGLKSGGVVVTRVVPGPAASAGIQRGDLLLRLGKQEISSGKQLRQLVAAAPTGKPLPLLVQRGANTLYLAVTPQARNG